MCVRKCRRVGRSVVPKSIKASAEMCSPGDKQSIFPLDSKMNFWPPRQHQLEMAGEQSPRTVFSSFILTSLNGLKVG